MPMRPTFTFWITCLWVFGIPIGLGPLLWGQSAWLIPQPTSFPDSLYRLHDWKSFCQLPFAHDTIDLDHPDLELLDAAVFFATNKARGDYLFPPLTFSPELRDMARYHATEMAYHRFIGHENPFNPEMASMFLRSKFFQAQAYSENVASYFLMNYQSGSRYITYDEGGEKVFLLSSGPKILRHTYWSFALALVNAWMNSKGHRVAILDPQMHTLGCGIMVEPPYFRKGIPMAMCTQNFGRHNPLFARSEK